MTKALRGTPEAVVLWKGSKWIDYPSFLLSASSMSLSMLPAMLPTMRLSPWNDFDLLIPIPLQPKAASSRLPWLCLKISERRECWRGWELRTLYSVSLCPYFFSRSPTLQSVLFIPWPYEDLFAFPFFIFISLRVSLYKLWLS